MKSKKVKHTIKPISDILNKESVNLKNYIVSRYGEGIIKKPSRHSNGEKQITFDKSYFNDITESTFRKLIEKTDNERGFYDDVISLDKLVNFLNDGSANNSNTKGTYQELIPFVIAMYDIECSDGLPDFNIVDEKIRERIEPQRTEYLICWWIKYQISIDDFIKSNNECKKLCEISYQHNIYERFYDASIEQLNILFEFHESGSTHLHNQNDELKRCIAMIKGNTIIYLIESEFKKDPITYLKNLWDNDIKPSIYKELMKHSKTIRYSFCDYSFLRKLKNELVECYKKMINIDDDLKDDMQLRITKLENMLTDFNNKLIKKIFEWKEKSIRNHEEFVICIDDIIMYTNFDDSNKFRKYVELNFNSKKLKNKIYIGWSSLIELLNDSEKMNMDERSIIIKYVTSIQEIYEEIINIILFRDDEKSKLNENTLNRVINHIEQKKDNEYQQKLNRITSKYDVLQEQLKLLKSSLKKLCQMGMN